MNGQDRCRQGAFRRGLPKRPRALEENAPLATGPFFGRARNTRHVQLDERSRGGDSTGN